jgi:thymidylate synthase (FAD)
MKAKLISKTMVTDAFVSDLLTELEMDGMPEEKLAEVSSLFRKPEGIMAYTARVSSPNQINPTYAKLLKYCADHNHWSVFEMVDATVEIQTSRMIAPQILRHRSMNFQEFSQRYQSVSSDGIELYVARRQDNKNRQNSIDDLSDEIKAEWERRQLENWKSAFEHYKWALDNDIAKECARAVLPLQTKTKMYMKGSLRSWLHYVNLRASNGTQKEHADIALAIKSELIQEFPVFAEAVGWTE